MIFRLFHILFHNLWKSPFFVFLIFKVIENSNESEIISRFYRYYFKRRNFLTIVENFDSNRLFHQVFNKYEFCVFQNFYTVAKLACTYSKTTVCVAFQCKFQKSNIEIFRKICVLFDKYSSGLNLVTHKK